MASDIILNGSEGGVTECSLSYSREGYVPWVYVVGGNTRIETTLFLDNADFVDSLELKAGWVGEATEEQKKTDPTKTDVYSRFTTDAEDDIYSELDFAGIEEAEDFDEETPPTPRGVAGPLTYRGFKPSTFNYDTANEAVSGYAMIESKDDVWVFSGSIGLGSRVQDGAIPYLRIQAGQRELEVTNKDKNKAITCIVEGGSHIVVESYQGQNDDDIDEADKVVNKWFCPLTISSADRFKRHKVYKSYREGPIEAEETEPYERDDIDACKTYADQLLESSTVPSINGTITLLGRTQFSIGDIIGNIINGDKSTPVNLAVVDQGTSYSPPREAGSSGEDSVTIELGRK